MLEQLLLSFSALALAVLVGLPIALWLGHIGRGGFLAINLTNIGRAVPTFALLALLVTADFPGRAEFGPFGRAGLATLIALTLFALPPIITNSYVAVREVPADVKQAADGMGMTGAQKFFRVELPLALPLVMSGVRLALVQVWATATIAALVAGPGLGRVITDGFFRTNYAKGLAGAVVVAVVALVLELLAAGRSEPSTRTHANRSGTVSKESRAGRLGGGRTPNRSAADRRIRPLHPDTRGTCRGTQKEHHHAGTTLTRHGARRRLHLPRHRAPPTTRSPEARRATPRPAVRRTRAPSLSPARASLRPRWSPRCTSSCSPMPATAPT